MELIDDLSQDFESMQLFDGWLHELIDSYKLIFV